MDIPDIRYARGVGDVDIAYSEFGRKDGPRVVWVSGFISHLELNWEAPPYANLIGPLAEACRVLAFDKRGTGLSGRDIGFGSLAERMDDVRAVMDACAWPDAHLYGTAARFVTTSERVLATVLFTDIIDSTLTAVRLGDQQWRRLLDRHDTESKRCVHRFGGRMVKQTGDGMLTTFDDPRAACSVRNCSATRWRRWDCRSAPVSTPARSSGEEKTSAGSPYTSGRASHRSPARVRCSSRGRCATSSLGQTCTSKTGARTS
jgi:hypothetical protein